ncbi:hypothetical protein DO021_06315 [Desulfobacter hydrogenophilus]|uniref:DUF4157 domain-containing protein n=1 Tax=Desulfobacter hydrogenophilus TaxID=2291 RepID=A0A328FH72_9BACT|nr:DUF4157 domain-containing protein [Desulfobacter hydrogenophilus]NDY71161.1 DUF4157 domain-containing protein [Desulfobacter hydrogenophilus]QBH14238.1 DUF4157 domain-containing protein [Desulfobacter hydrogenophilus]RAM02832.1 hypothetical protein DO021_06315 [Desulfobacter hydrogenophilus]
MKITIDTQKKNQKKPGVSVSHEKIKPRESLEGQVQETALPFFLKRVAMSSHRPPEHRLPIDEEENPLPPQRKLSTVQRQPLKEEEKLIQADLEMGAPDDKYELEADQMAEKVLQMDDSAIRRNPVSKRIPPLLQRLIMSEEEEHTVALQAKESSSIRSHTSTDIGETVSNMKRGGQPMSTADRTFFEQRMHADFGGVRVHTDNVADITSRDLNARAFTVGKHIAFRDGGYLPGTDAGRRLIAHELTHVIQQTGRGRITDKLDRKTNAHIKADDLILKGDASAITPHATRFISRSLIQRVFDPTVTRHPDILLVLLNDPDSNIQVNVTNHREAPSNTRFNWRWQSIDPEKVEDMGATPQGLPRASLKMKAKKLFSSLNMTPELEVGNQDSSTTTHTDPVGVATMIPLVDWGIESMSRGDRGGQGVGLGTSFGSQSYANLFVGDTITMTGVFGDIDNAQTAGIEFSRMSFAVDIAGGSGAARIDIGEPTWVEPNRVEVTITALTAGNSFASIDAYIPGRDNAFSHDIELNIVNDPRGFKDKCSTANSLILARYSAGRDYFLQASQNYKNGYEAHKSILDDRTARAKLAREIILGVLFGALGGVAGGAVGSALGAWFKSSGKLMAETLGAAGTGAITDAAKDLTKYVARLPGRLLREVGGTSSGTGAAQPGSGGGTTPAGVTGRGETGPAAVDPFGWYLGVERVLMSEKTEASNLVLQAQRVADLALDRGENVEFDWDPEVVVEDRCTIDGKPLNELGEPPSASQYEKAFWAAWLSQYAYTLRTDIGGTYVVSNVGGKFREDLEAVAQRHNENLDDWIVLFGGQLHDQLSEQESGPGIITWD